MSFSINYFFCQLGNGVLDLNYFGLPIVQTRALDTMSVVSHRCGCLGQVCENNIICSFSRSLSISHMMTNTEYSTHSFGPGQTKNLIRPNWFQSRILPCPLPNNCLRCIYFLCSLAIYKFSCFNYLICKLQLKFTQHTQS